MAILDVISDTVGELTTWTFATTLRIPDQTTGPRPPLLSEITSAELSVFLVETGAFITAWTYVPGINPPITGTWVPGSEVLKNIDVKDTGRGDYVEATGLLTITLHAGDNPSIAAGTTEGAKEKHEANITVRYNVSVDQFYKRVQFTVQNHPKVPRVP